MNRYHDTVLGFRLAIHPALRVINFAMDGYAATFHDLKFIVTMSEEDDKKVWVHCSVSRRDRKTPTYEDLLTLRKYTLPASACAYQVFPPTDEYFDEAIKGQAPVLHLWSCVEGRFTPDFRSKETGMI